MTVALRVPYIERINNNDLPTRKVITRWSFREKCITFNSLTFPPTVLIRKRQHSYYRLLACYYWENNLKYYSSFIGIYNDLATYLHTPREAMITALLEPIPKQCCGGDTDLSRDNNLYIGLVE